MFKRLHNIWSSSSSSFVFCMFDCMFENSSSSEFSSCCLITLITCSVICWFSSSMSSFCSVVSSSFNRIRFRRPFFKSFFKDIRSKMEKYLCLTHFDFSFFAQFFQFLYEIDEFHFGKQPMSPVLIFIDHLVQILKL